MLISMKCERNATITWRGGQVEVLYREPSATEISDYYKFEIDRSADSVKIDTYSAQLWLGTLALLDVVSGLEYQKDDDSTAPLNASVVLSEKEIVGYSKALACDIKSWKDLVPVEIRQGLGRSWTDSTSIASVKKKE